MALQDRPSNVAEIMVGRGLAMAVHPHAAWHRLPPAKRALLVFSYFAASYLTVLSALRLFGA